MQLVWFGLAQADGTSREALDAAATRFARALGGDLASRGAARALALSAIDPAEGTAHARAMAGGPAPFEALVECRIDGASFADVAGLAARHAGLLAGAVDPARSGVIAGTAHVIAKVAGAMINAFWLRPAKGRSIAECQQHWRTVHLEIAASLRGSADPEPGQPLSGYEQFHADEAASAAIAKAAELALADYTGAVRSPTDHPEVFRQTLSARPVETIALDDERNFIDHSRSFMALYG